MSQIQELGLTDFILDIISVKTIIIAIRNNNYTSLNT